MFTISDMTEQERNLYKQLSDLRQTLEKYLSLGSCDGPLERRPLRKELATLIGVEYDENKNKITKLLS